MRVRKTLYIIIITLLMTLSGPLQAVTASQLSERDNKQPATTIRLPNEGRSDLQELIQRVDANVGDDSAEKPSSEPEVDETETVEEPVEDSGVSEPEVKEAPEATDSQKPVAKNKAPRAITTNTNGTSTWTFDSDTGLLVFGAGTLAERIDNNLTNADVDPTTVLSIQFKSGVVAPTAVTYLFANLGQLSQFIGLNNLNTASVTDMSDWFNQCTDLTSLDLSSWNVTKVTSFSYMFYRTTHLTTLNLSNWGTSRTATNVNMQAMFAYTSSLTNLNITNFKTTNVINMQNVFGHTGLTTLDLSDWDVTKVTTFFYMFSNSSITTLNLSNWGVGRTATNVNMRGMFYMSELSASLNLTNFKTTNITNMSRMFYSTWASDLDLSDWDVTKVTTFAHMFVNNPVMRELNLSNWGVGRTATDVDMSYMFYSAYSYHELNLTNFKTTNVTNMSYMFCFAFVYSPEIRISTLDLSDWDVTKVTTFAHMFDNNRTLYSLNLSNWDVGRATTNVDMSYMFTDADLSTKLNLTNFKTTNVTNMSYMFDHSSIRILDLGKWNVTSATDVTYMFSMANSLWKITLGENVKFPNDPSFGTPGTNQIIPGTNYKTIAPSWQIVGTGTDFNPKGAMVTTTQMYADRTEPVTYVWANKALAPTPVINTISSLTFGTLAACDFFNGNSPLATNMATGSVALEDLDNSTTYNVTVAQTSDWTTDGESATIAKSNLKIKYGANDLSTGASSFWSGTSATETKSIAFNHDDTKNFSIWLNPSAVLDTALLGKQLESELTWTLSETP